MSDTLLTVVSVIVGVAAVGVMAAVVVFFWKLGTKLDGAGVEALAASAAARGWQFAHTREIGRIHRTWSGTTDDVTWTAQHTGISQDGGNEGYRRHTFRWHTTLAGGPAMPLVLIHERSSLDGVEQKTKALPGVLQGIASAAVDRIAPRYFGPAANDVDLSAWRAVDGHGVPGMRVLAPAPDASERLICQRIAPVIASHAAALAAGGEAPAILIQQDALHLAATASVSAADVERAVALGTGIARALTSR